MTITRRHSAIATTMMAAALTIGTAYAQEAGVPDTIESRLGPLTFEHGYPTQETAKKVFDEIDYQRAVQCYLWAYPAVSFRSIRIAANADGMDSNDIGIYDNFADTKGLWLTANDTTIYALTNIDLGKDGPVVVDIPPGAIVGLIDNFWQKSITDLGLPGPDGDKGESSFSSPPTTQVNCRKMARAFTSFVPRKTTTTPWSAVSSRAAWRTPRRWLNSSGA